jgi:putative solute:sodium symporter small subunit
MDDRAYWRANVRLIVVLLSIWAFVSLGCSILLIDVLNRFQFFGAPFGFWMSQQGTIWVFLALIGVYVWRMEALDRQHGIDRKGDGQ